MDILFFWFFSLGMLGSGLAVILNRNPVASALSFIVSIAFMAALFVLLHAFFLAAVQILVTAGAVMVLFLFIIMLLDIRAEEHARLHLAWMACAAALGLGLLFLFGRVLSATPAGQVTARSLPDAPAQASAAVESPSPHNADDTHSIGRLLFSTYLAPFEITSLLILVATIGVIVICKEDNPKNSEFPGK